jgi:hypothetical protein
MNAPPEVKALGFNDFMHDFAASDSITLCLPDIQVKTI